MSHIQQATSQEHEYIMAVLMNRDISRSKHIRNNRSSTTTQSSMGYYHHRRRSSFHMMGEATLGSRFGISARRSSSVERSSESRSRSNQRRLNDKPKAPTHPCYLRVVVQEPPHFADARHKAKKPAHPHLHHRIVVPEPSHSWETTFHAFCVATDVTYARLSDRLDRLHDHKAALALRLRAHGGSKASWESLGLVQKDVAKLERTLRDMRQKIGEQTAEWNGKGEIFMVGGRWAAFL